MKPISEKYSKTQINRMSISKYKDKKKSLEILIYPGFNQSTPHRKIIFVLKSFFFEKGEIMILSGDEMIYSRDIG